MNEFNNENPNTQASEEQNDTVEQTQEQTPQQEIPTDVPTAETENKTSESDGYNSQYTYNNVNPDPTNYFNQKHYIPEQFNNADEGNQLKQEGYYYPPQNKKPSNNGKKGLKIFVAILLAVVIFTVGAGVGRIAIPSITSNDITSSDNEDSLKYNGEDIDVNSSNPIQRDDITPDENGRYTADQVAQIVGESVVNIQVYSKTDTTAGATASGVILNEKGYIITNDHIYSEVKNAKFVITMNNGESYKASYVAGDQRSDIAVLKFDDMPKNLTAASFADSSQIKAGDDVIAIGSPYGLSGTVTKGIVSYPSRRITTSSTDENGQPIASYSMRVIQTDVALNSGNSGGALVNMYGQVVGINSSKIAISGYEGLCFAIPSNDAVKYAKSLVKNGVVSNRARLGITYTAITSATAVLNDIPAGLLIQEIDPSSSLANKGIAVGEKGDIITEMNSQKITTSDVALDIIDDSEAGDVVEIKIYSQSTKQEKTYKVELLEDKSNTSYVNEIPKPSTSSSYNSDSYDDFEFYQSPFEFGE